MPSRKCPQCGTVNFNESVECRRCTAPLDAATPAAAPLDAAPPAAPRSWRNPTAGQQAITITIVTLGLLLGIRTSLILTSNDLDWVQHERVEMAISLLRDRGFEQEAFVLGHAAHYRSSDNWWNRYVGHSEAYAATNFPFEVVTLYPRFFTVPIDDTERAVVLLHEAQHLLGHGEDAALDYVWAAKPRVGWTEDKYGTTRVWRNTKEWTCGPAQACGSTAR
jgi:hypothetical protein